MNNSAARLSLARCSRSRTDSRPKGSWLWLGYLWVGNNVFDSIVLHWASWSSLSYNQASVPGPMFRSMSSKAHQPHIVLSELMTSIV